MNISIKKRRVFLVCDNTWWVEGIRYESLSWLDLVDYISFAKLNDNAIRNVDFNRDIIVYASSENPTMEILTSLNEKFIIEKELHNKKTLDFVYVGNQLARTLIFTILRNDCNNINFFTIKRNDINLEKIIEYIDNKKRSYKESGIPMLSKIESLILNKTIQQHTISEISDDSKLNPKKIYAVRRKIAEKFGYSCFNHFYIDFCRSVHLFYSVIKS